MSLDRVVRVDRREEATITVRRQLELMPRLHYDLTFSVNGRYHCLLEEDERTGVTAEVLVVLEELRCLLMVESAGHDQHFAFLNLRGELVRAVRKHLYFVESLNKYLEDRLARGQSDVVHSFWVLESESRALAAGQDYH